MTTLQVIDDALTRIEKLMRISMKAHEGLAELRKEMAGIKEETPHRDLSGLTHRQREIFDLLAQDIPVAEIARRLKIASRTVDAHRNSIREHLKFATASELNQFARTARG